LQKLQVVAHEANGKSLSLKSPTAAVETGEEVGEYPALKLKKAKDGLSEIEKLVHKHSKPLPAMPRSPSRRNRFQISG
jgi:hypothetical protein